MHFAPYDIDMEAYPETSWIGVGDSSNPGRALVRLLTIDEPFDTVQVADIDLVTGLATSAVLFSGMTLAFSLLAGHWTEKSHV